MSTPQSEHTEPRIVKKKKGGGGHHGGAWKVAYADFVTAMMALFIVLWIMSQSQSIRLSVAQYFKNPGVLPGSMGLMEASDMGGAMPTPGHSQELQTPASISPEVKQDRSALEEIKKRIQEVIAQLPELNKLKDQVLLEVTPEGLRIELLERETSTFFDIGSAALKDETRKILSHIAQEVGRLPNRVAIEGHTDSRPYGKANYSNWELSADRANAARRLMDESGLRPDQIIAVRGYADRTLRNPKDPLDYQNRRVSIIVIPQVRDPGLPAAPSPLPEAGSPPPPAGQPQPAAGPQGKPEPPGGPPANAAPAAAGKPAGRVEEPAKASAEGPVQLNPAVDAAVKPPEAQAVKPPAPPVPATPAAPAGKPEEPGAPSGPLKDASPEGQVQAEVKKLFEPFKTQERLGW